MARRRRQRTGCAGFRMLAVGLLALGFVLVPGVVAAQNAAWSALLAPQLTRQVDEATGPDVGGLGGAITVIRKVAGSTWGWGGSAAFHDLGTFTPDNAPERDMRAMTAGVRVVRGSLQRGAFFSTGLDLLRLQESRDGVAWSSDPGIAGYAGVGWIRRAGPDGAGVFGELGLTGALASGEYTAGGGVYVSLRVGLIL